ncbi:MAG: hypothetical protein U1E36_05275 [Rickettsiales bacterium]
MQRIASDVYPCDSIRAGNGLKSYIGVVIESETSSLSESEAKKVRDNLEEFKTQHPLPEDHDVYLARSPSGVYFIIYETPGFDSPRFANRPNKTSAALGVAKAASIDYFSEDEGLCTSSAIAKHLFDKSQQSKISSFDPVYIIEELNSIMKERTGHPAITNFSPILKQPEASGGFAARLGVTQRACETGWIDRS